MATRPDDTNLVLWQDFDSAAALYDDEVGNFPHADWAVSGTATRDTGTFKTGSSSVDLDITGSSYFNITSLSTAQENLLQFDSSGVKNKDMTIFGWFYKDGFASNNTVMGMLSANQMRIRTGTNSQISLAVWDGAASIDTQTHPTVLSTGVWYAYAARIRNNASGDYAIKLMNDGVEATRSTGNGLALNRVGRFAYGLFGADRFDGKIDTHCIWREYLTDDNLDYLYNAGAGKTYAQYLADAVTESSTTFTQTAKQAVMLGGNPIATVADTSEKHSLSVVYSSDFTSVSNYFIMIAGIPCALYVNGNGQYSLGVYQMSSDDVSEASDTFVYKGCRFATFTDSSSRSYFPATEDSSGSTTVASTTSWNGIPLALNSDDQLLVTQVSGSIQARRSAPIGGVPVEFVQINDRWYLAVAPA